MSVSTPSRWLEWRPPVESEPVVLGPGEPERLLVIRENNPQPGSRALWLCRHHQTGTNRFGADATKHPFAVLCWAAWLEGTWDLRLVNWFATADEAARVTGGSFEPPRQEALSY